MNETNSLYYQDNPDQMHNSTVIGSMPSSPYLLKKGVLLIFKEGSHLVIRSIDVVALKASGNYTYIYFRNGAVELVPKTLKTFQYLLLHGFLKLNRGLMINAQYLEEVSRVEPLRIRFSEKVFINITRRTLKNLLNSFLVL
jgi:DNA-binding LytR/AlgR family response regulator